jgi:hypothetical protein
MRERLFEFWPLLLIGVLVIAFQLSRGGAPLLLLSPFQAASPTPILDAAISPTAVPRRPAPVPAATLVPPPCSSSRPRFAGGLATLKTALGAKMGAPLECEHPVDNHGDTQQKTSTGLAYYRQQLNVACFTTGWDHWALTERGVVYWTGDAVDPPSDAAAVAE